MSNKTEITRALRDLIIENDNEFVAILSGEWGIGKTYFWNEFKEKNLTSKQVVYVSLFGLNSLDEIKNEIIFQLSKYTKFLNKSRNKIKSLKGGNIKFDDIGFSIGGALINSSLSFFSTKDFNNIVICFDDFERLSDKVSLKDVMGLVSQFKEQKKCKVIMILNEKELNKLSTIDGKKYDEIFALYKEKIVDYTFNYQPNFNEIFKIIEKDIEYFQTEWVSDFFKEINLENIRIMKQVVYHLNHFKFIESYQLEDIVIKEFLKIALPLFVFKARCNYKHSELVNMINYRSEKAVELLYKEKNIEYEPIAYNDKYENCIEQNQYIGFSNDTVTTKGIQTIVYNYLDNYTTDREGLKKLLKENNKLVKGYEIRDEIRNLTNSFHADFQITNQEISEKVLLKLKNNKEIVYQFYGYENFKKVIDYIKKFTIHKDISIVEKEFIENYLNKNYITANYDYDDSIELIQKDYSWANEYITKLKKSHKIKNNDEIFTIMNNFINNDIFNPEEGYKLSNISSEEYKRLILNSKEFVSLLIKFLYKLNRYGWEELDKAQHSIKKALIQLKDTNKDYEEKVNKIVETTKISLDK